MDDKELKGYINNIRSKIRVTKITATRSVKGRGGDAYAAFSAAWDTVQDDAGGGPDGSEKGEASSGMTLAEARVAHLLVAMQADIAAYDAAKCGSSISIAHHKEAVLAIRNNYTLQIREILAT